MPRPCGMNLHPFRDNKAFPIGILRGLSWRPCRPRSHTVRPINMHPPKPIRPWPKPLCTNIHTTCGGSSTRPQTTTTTRLRVPMAGGTCVFVPLRPKPMTPTTTRSSNHQKKNTFVDTPKRVACCLDWSRRNSKQPCRNAPTYFYSIHRM